MVNGRTLAVVGAETGTRFCLDIVVAAGPEYDQLVMVKWIINMNSLIPPPD